MPIESFVAAMVFSFDPPSILFGETRDDLPFAQKLGMKILGPMPTEALVSGSRHAIEISDRIEFPVNFDAGDLSRFLAKVAHGYAISKLGLDYFSSLFLPSYILGKEEGILTYVGGYVSPLNLQVLPGVGYHRMMIEPRGNLVSVCIQLFIDNGDPPPIYEVIVGKKSPLSTLLT